MSAPDPQQVLPVDVAIRTMPEPPLGGRPAINAISMAEMGALAGAAGLERGQLTSLMRRIQTMAVEVTLGSMNELISAMHNMNTARLNTLAQQVRNLPEAPLRPVGVMQAVFGVSQTPVVSYVSRAEVLQLIALAMVQNPGA